MYDDDEDEIVHRFSFLSLVIVVCEVVESRKCPQSQTNFGVEGKLLYEWPSFFLSAEEDFASVVIWPSFYYSVYDAYY